MTTKKTSAEPIDQMFKVPNNEEGRYFISLMKKYRQSGLQLRIRGRKPNYAKATKAGWRKGEHFWQSVPQECADELGIYFRQELNIRDYNGNPCKQLFNIGTGTLAMEINSAKSYRDQLKKAEAEAEKHKDEYIFLMRRVQNVLGSMADIKKAVAEFEKAEKEL